MIKKPALFLFLLFGAFYVPAQSLVILAGTGARGYNGDAIPAITAQLNNPTAVVMDKKGNIYIADAGNYRVRKIDGNGIITTVAGTGTWGYSGDNGAAVNAEMTQPTALTLDPSGNLYIADQNNGVIRKIDTAGIITTVITDFNSAPSGIVFDAAGNMYITEQDSNRIIKVDKLGNKTTIAGNNTAGDSGDYGPATLAELKQPYGICLDAKGNLYFTDYGNNQVRKIDTAGIIIPVAGDSTGMYGYNGDGIPATTARLWGPEGVICDKQGNVYIADGANARIRKVDTSGIISTYVGPGGYINDTIGFESAVYFDASGSMYLVDASEMYLRKVVISGYLPLAGFSASPNVICSGSSVNFSDTSTNSPNSRVWTFTGGTPDTSTVRNPAIIYNTAGIYPVKLVVSNSNGSDSLTKTGYITVNRLPVPVVTTADSLICSGDSTQVCTADTFISYLWNTGTTSSCTSAGVAGGYWVTVTDANHCSAVSGHQEINVYPVPSVSIIEQGDTLSSYGQVKYQWVLNGAPINGATGESYIAHQQGFYTLQITDTNGCTAISQPVSITGVNNLSAEPNVSIYPNPCSGASAQLSVGSELIGSDLEMYDDEGRLVFQSAIKNQKSAITISELPAGVYYLRISSADISIVRKLVKL